MSRKWTTVHDIVLAKTSAGSYQVISDAYDEENVTGYVSSDYVAPPVEEIERTDTALSPEPGEEINASLTYMPNPSDCFTYANKWVKHIIETEDRSGVSNWGYYNTEVYDYAYGEDCANYVSQCLRAGGFTFNPTKTSNRSTTSTSQWWHAEGGDLSQSSITWRCADDFYNYWTGTKGYGKADITYKTTNDKKRATNVYPGNPIMSDNFNHVAICVGYNSYDQPIYNGHTRDVYHGVVSGYEETIFLNCTGNHAKTYESYSSEKHTVTCSKCTKTYKEDHTSAYKKYNDRQHILYCTKCNRNMGTAANHVFKLSRAYYTCSVCGYKTTVKPELNAIIQPMYVERYFV